MRPSRTLAANATLLLSAAVTTALTVALAVATAPASTADGRDTSLTAAKPAVLSQRVIGKSVKKRPIRAYELGERGKPEVLLVSSMHGDEKATRQILWSLRDGKPIRGIHLWVVPTYNPDGVARSTRKNAHGVDLNRNYPYKWKDLDGSYESGPKPGSEPETRAMMRFLRNIKPKWILSFHQPLHGVDTDTKNKRFAHRVARKLHLPAKRFDCGGVCHGTMTMWYNHKFRGSALTAEYGASPPKQLMRVKAPRQVLTIWGARRR
jgi:protein MpaA